MEIYIYIFIFLQKFSIILQNHVKFYQEFIKFHISCTEIQKIVQNSTNILPKLNKVLQFLVTFKNFLQESA